MMELGDHELLVVDWGMGSYRYGLLAVIGPATAGWPP
jgi:hypothetical protein